MAVYIWYHVKRNFPSVQCTLLCSRVHYTSLVTRYQKHMAMFNWSPCTLKMFISDLIPVRAHFFTSLEILCLLNSSLENSLKVLGYSAQSSVTMPEVRSYKFRTHILKLLSIHNLCKNLDLNLEKGQKKEHNLTHHGKKM